MIYTPLNLAKVAEYLRYRMPERTDLTITDVKRSYPGMSRETWWITLQWTEAGAQKRERMVVRLDPPGGGLSGRALAEESEIYRRLMTTDVPVPPLICHETAPEWLLEGRDFSLRGWVDGSVEPEGLRTPGPEGDTAREEIVKEHMRKLAAIHAVDWHQLGFDEFMEVPAELNNIAVDQIEYQARMLEANRSQPYSAFSEVKRWLLQNPPPAPKRIVLRKHNNGIGEEVWQGRRIAAMCDWESASLGDAALDLAVAMGTTMKFWNEEKALAYYNEVSGNEVTMEAVRWYQRYWHLAGWAGLSNCLRNFKAGKDNRVQMITLGCLLVNLRQSLLAQAAGI